MGVFTIDGTIEEAVLKRRVRGTHIYEQVRFRPVGKPPWEMRRALVMDEVAGHVRPGARGRFYVYTAADQQGIFGVRDEAGAEAFAFPRTNEKLMLVMSLLLAVTVALSFAAELSFPMIGLLVLLFTVPIYFIYRAARLSATRLFEAERDRVPPPAERQTAAAPALGG